jgi:hypothetical protein
VNPELAEAQDRVHRLITGLLHGDRGTAAEELAQLDELEILRVAMVSLDLAAYVHTRWADALCMDDDTRNAAWAEMLLDVAAWREGLVDT